MSRESNGSLPNGEPDDSYEGLFADFSNRMEKRLIRIAQVLAILLVVLQLLLLHPGMRYWLVRVERLEGDPLSASSPAK